MKRCIVVIAVLLLLSVAAGSVSGATALDYTVKIYGNANLDDEIDELDIGYIEEIIAGTKDETPYADANQDGTIDQADIEHVKRIIDGTTDYIIIRDSNDRKLKLPYPIQKVVVLWSTIAEPIQAMGAGNKIVGIDDITAKRTVLLPGITQKPSVGKRAEPDIEAIVKLDPDVVITLATKDEIIGKIQSAGIPVIIASYGTNRELDDTFAAGMAESKLLGYILGVPDGARDYINFYKKHLAVVEERISKISDADRPSVLYTYDNSKGKIQSSGGGNMMANLIAFAGARDITTDTPGEWIELDLEFPLKENAQFILFEDAITRDELIGYGVSDPTQIGKKLQEYKDTPGFNTLDAVKTDDVYAMPWGLVSACHWLATLYQAKLFQPDLFADLDVPAIHQEYLEKYLGLGPNAYTGSIFIYPMPEGWAK